jgi:hypothetical protein
VAQCDGSRVRARLLVRTLDVVDHAIALEKE